MTQHLFNVFWSIAHHNDCLSHGSQISRSYFWKIPSFAFSPDLINDAKLNGRRNKVNCRKHRLHGKMKTQNITINYPNAFCNFIWEYFSERNAHFAAKWDEQKNERLSREFVQTQIRTMYSAWWPITKKNAQNIQRLTWNNGAIYFFNGYTLLKKNLLSGNHVTAKQKFINKMFLFSKVVIELYFFLR